MSNHDFLLELLCEELPAKLLVQLIDDLTKAIMSELNIQRLSFTSQRSFATPRRLALLLTGLPSYQTQSNIEKKGPATDAKEIAIKGFMRTVGADKLADLTQKKIQGKTYYYYQTKHAGAPTIEVLGKIIPSAVDRISQHKLMRWGDDDFSFTRPVRNIVALLDDNVIAVDMFGLRSCRQTLGLRFARLNKTTIKQAKDYEKVMTKLGIIADFNKREQAIKTQIQSLAQKHNVTIDINSNLLKEVTALTEAPQAFIGNFDTNFLALPKEVLILVMQSQQKYFAMFDNAGNLLPHFVGVANLTDSNQDLAEVKKGNERVIFARLSDAKFFYEQDSVQPLFNKIKRLRSVIFMQSLGSLYDKTQRLVTIGQQLSVTLNLSKSQQMLLNRACLLSKCDLVSQMVVEFPKLQGVMGSYYARGDKEDYQVVQAISTQYYPRYANDKLPDGLLASLLSLIDKLDTIIGVCALGKIPTSSKDPYALRRLALGVIRIIITHQLKLDLKRLIEQFLLLFSLKTKPHIVELILSFITERLKAYYQEQNISTKIYQAVAAVPMVSLLDFDKRILALMTFSKQASATSLITLNKRINHTLVHIKANKLSTTIDTKLLQHKSELVLYSAIAHIKQNHSIDYQQKILLFCALEKRIDDFFTNVLVDDKRTDIKQNRLNMLYTTQQLLLTIADLSLL